MHGRRLQRQDLIDRHGLRVTPGAQTFLDLAPSTWPGELVAIGDSLLRQGNMTVETLTERLSRA